MRKNKNKDSFSKWLNKLQQESWQLELLISGVAIFALFESLKILPTYYPIVQEIGATNLPVGVIFNVALFILHSGVKIFLINLIIHALIRSLWIGALGLRYVSGDIDFEDLNYNDKFTNHLKQRIGPFDNYIDKLENFSSILFSYTFLLFFILLSLFLYLFWAILIIYFTTEFLTFTKVVTFSLILIISVYLLLGLLVAFDFLTLGYLKRIKNKFFTRLYLPIYKFYSFATLSFLWRPMLFNFLDHPYTKRLFFLIIPYLFFLGFLGGFDFYSYGHYPDFIHQLQFKDADIINENSFNLSFYEEERNRYSATDVFQKKISEFSIPSKKISGSLGEIFVKAISNDKWLIAKIDSTIQPLREEGLTQHTLSAAKTSFEAGFNEGGRDKDMEILIAKYGNHPNFQQKRDSLLQTFEEEEIVLFKEQFLKSKAILKNAIILKIDTQQIEAQKITCDFYTHPQGKIQGMLCFYPIDSLSIGRHYLTVGKVIGKKINRPNTIILDTAYTTIPFIYTGL